MATILVMTGQRRRPTTVAGAVAVVCAAALLAGCGATGAKPIGSTARGPSHGTASVACAGSLLKLYDDTLGPTFEKATGDSFGGPLCAGSLALASEILSHEISPGVFLSLGPKPIEELFPAKRATFALAVATDPLVIGYSQKSRYYGQLNAIRSGRAPLSDLFRLFATPGFRLGRTDPTQDPQGATFMLMCELAQRVLHLPAGETAHALGVTPGSPYGSASQMLDESALPTDIAEGVVDAGSEYLPEAKQFGLDYITLPPSLDFAAPSEAALYSSVSLVVAGKLQAGAISTLDVGLVDPGRGALQSPADRRADSAFVAFMLSGGRSLLRRAGYLLVSPVLYLAPGVTGPAEALPSSVRSLYHALGGSVAAP